MHKIILTLATLLVLSGCTAPGDRAAGTRQADALHASVSGDNCPAGCPAGGSSQTLYREAYTLNNNPQQKLANWVAYKITRLSQASGRTRGWKQDPDLPVTDTLAPGAYKGAWAALAVDRGHQAPLAGLAGYPDWPSLNYLSNITPQMSALNQGAWARLEDKERALANRPDVDAVYSVTGPVFDDSTPVLPGAAAVHLPAAYWKVIFTGTDPARGKYAAFLIDQSAPRSASYCDYQVTVSAIEAQTRPALTIWPALPPAIAATVKHVRGTLSQDLGCP